MRRTPYQPATDDEVAELRQLIGERDQATTIETDEDVRFAIRCDELLPKLLVRLDRSEEALRFYGDENSYQHTGASKYYPKLDDSGKLARNTLEGVQ